MKRIIILAACLWMAAVAIGQDTVSGPDGKLEDWYMTYWFDTCPSYRSPDRDCMGMYNCYVNDPTRLYTNPEYVEHPMALRGVDVWVGDVRQYGIGGCAVDISSFAPEYIYVFKEESDRTLTLLDSVRWDTAEYRWLKEPVNVDSGRFGFCYTRLYRVYFKDPVIVDSVFHLAGTQHSNELKMDCIWHYPVMYTFMTIDVASPPGRTWCEKPLRTYARWTEHTLSHRDTLMWIEYNTHTWGLNYMYGMYMPIMEETVRLEVESADTNMGTAGPYGDWSINQTWPIWARAKQGYRFTHWNDGDTNNPRDIELTGDTSFTAYFDSNAVHRVEALSSSEYGRVDGGGDYYHGDSVELRATPLSDNYIFTHWNDGDTNNPRRFVITCDTTFVADFARDETGVGQVGENPPFTLTPNPTHDKVTVAVGMPATPNCWLTLRDEAGREVLRSKMEGRTHTISTRELQAGVYFVTLDTPQGTCTQKLVVE